MPSLRNQSWSVNPTGMPHNSAGIAVKAEEEKRRMSTAHAGGVHSQGVEANSCNYENDVCCNEDAVEDNEMDFAAIGNGCGEAVSSPSSCAEAFLLGPSLAVASRPAEWSLRSLPAASASAGKVGFAAAPPPPPLPPHPPVAASATAAAATEKSRPPSFTAQAMRAITSNAEAAAPPSSSSRHPSPSFPATAAAAAARAVTGEDPMGVRQLYSLPPSVAGSCLSVSSLNRRGPGGCGSSGIVATAAAAEALPSPHHLPTSVAAAAAGVGGSGGDAFSMERFATFYEVALEELMSECERRVANAPAAWRAGQRRFLRGESNHDLATSTFSFDSPRSSGVSPVSGYAPQFGSSPSWNAPAYPPCFPAPGHNTHGLQTRGVAAQGSARTSAPPPPPALPSRHFFFSAATSGSAAAAAAAAAVRSAEAEGDVATEETVPALLAALGRHHGKMAPMVFIAALAYLARVTVHCVSEFLSITHANWYRLTTTAILVAAKVYDEHSSSRLNRHFARSSGIPLSELTRLELDFLYLSDFDLLLKEAEVEQWLTWMETLAVRRDVMTPLQTYFVHRPDATHAAFGGSNVGRTASLPSSSLCSAVLPESLEKSRANTAATTGAITAETSRTAGLSSEGTVVAATAETVSATSPLSAPAPRTFTHVRVGSNTMGGNTVSQQPSCAVSGQRRFTGTLSEAPASSAIPLHDLLHSPMLRSPVSSLAMPQSLFDGPRSTVSGVSLPGSATTPVVGLRATAVPPSPVHGVLSLCPPPHRSRLFSVVHGKREPPSPRSVRQLSRLGASPPSPLQPPPMEPHSPVGFFKQQSTQAGSGMGYGHRHSGSAVSGHGLQGAGMSASMASNTGVRAARDRSAVSDYVQAPATGTAVMRRQAGKEDRYSSSSTHTDPAAASAPSMSAASTNANGSGTRWGPFGMVQQVRDVLGVTASLVRGQLNVLAPAKAPEAAPQAPSRPLAHDTSSNSRHEQPYKPAYHRSSPAKMSGSSTNRVSAPAAAEATSPQAVSPGRHGHRAQERSSTRSPRARSTRQQQQEQVDDASGAAGYGYEEEGEYDEEDGEYYEEDAYGYYDEDGYYYPYEEGEEGEYDEEGEEEEGWYAEPEPEEETEYFQRCRLPLTHSPPSL